MSEIRIEITIDDEGTPPDAVTLQDSTGTFGVRRKDTLEVVVASGTPMVQDATDPTIWRHTVADVVPGVTYEWVQRVVFPDATDYFEDEETVPLEADCDALITVGDADAILDKHVTAADLATWTALSTTDKGVHLCLAQAMIDAGSWDGVKYSEVQDYAFPRTDDDGELIGVANDADPDSPLAPLAVREALALLAFSFAHRPDIWERRESIATGLASQSVSGVSEAYVASGGAAQVKGDLRAVAAVWARLGRFWRRGARIV